MEMEYASKGVAGAGLGTGIAGLSLGVLNAMGNGGLLGGLLGGNQVATAGIAGAIPAVTTAMLNSENKHITRSEFDLEHSYIKELAQKDLEISALNTDVKLRDANAYTDKKIVDTYTQLESHIRAVESTVSNNAAAQGVINANLTNGVSVLSNQVADINNVLSNITATKVPNTAVCPGWGNVCVTPTGCGNVN